jgi:glycosyltransferase involved in cell wall biosynthesis
LEEQKPVLLLAEMCNPNWASVPLVGWNHVVALSRETPVHLVTHAINESDIKEHNPGFPVTTIPYDRFDRIFERLVTWLFGSDYSSSALTMLRIPYYLWFECRVLWRFRKRLKTHSFRLVHRLTPVSPVIPSLAARVCKCWEMPFVVGPINGGLPWPKGYGSAARDREWISSFRRFHRFIPLLASTRRLASLIFVGSRFTLNDIPERYHGKCRYQPENGVRSDIVATDEKTDWGLPLRCVFVGRLVPLKGPDMVLTALRELLKNGRVKLDFIGDGPLRAELVEYAKQNDLLDHVTFHGWIADQREVQQRLSRYHLLTFPSVREFGGGVVVEAMAKGVVPIVMDYGGPGEIVDDQSGFKLPCEDERATTSRLKSLMETLVKSPEDLKSRSQNARQRILDVYTWESKVKAIIDGYDWVERGDER